MLTGNEIRRIFLDYFESQSHSALPSSPLIPASDPTLMFTNAGMVQFKNVFTGEENIGTTRATTSQKCLRVSGKHNDFENVGRTARHHTFFEMLGNFSFGDYFKQDAIRFAWELLTERYRLPKDKLWATVFEEDDEAAAIWEKETDVDPAQIVRMGAKGQLLGDGRHRPQRSVLGDHHRPGPARDPRDRKRDDLRRLGPLPRTVEPGLHAVQHRRRGRQDRAAQAVDRHGHGPGTDHGGPPGQGQQLRLGPVLADHPLRLRDRGSVVRRRRGDRRLPARGPPTTSAR